MRQQKQKVILSLVKTILKEVISLTPNMNDDHTMTKIWISESDSLETICYDFFHEDLAIETAMRDLKKYSKET